MVFTYERARRLEGTGVTANCVHPGNVVTNLNKEAEPWIRLARTLMWPVLLSPEQGSETVIHLASSPELEGMTGRYFIKKSPVPSSAESYSLDAARRLWEVSADLTKLKAP